MAWFEYDQNNSGGSFDIDPRSGLGPRVWIEAASDTEAQERALSLGIYFDGCDEGHDCDCCGDRWYRVWGAGSEYPEIHTRWDFGWHNEVYLHPLEGPFVVATAADYPEVLSRFIPANLGHA